MDNFKACKIDGYDVLRDSLSGIYYAKKDRRRLDVDDRSEDVQGVHRRTVTPTYARKRIITLEWYVDSLGNENEETAIKYLEDLFALQSDTSEVIPKQLYIKDMFDHEWILNVKVKSPFEAIEADDSFVGYAWKRRVVLESVESPVYKSLNEFSVQGEDGVYWGFAIPTPIDFGMGSYSNIIELSTTSNQASPIRWEITAVNAFVWPLTITEIWSGRYFKVDVDGVPGDVIIIDAEALTATKNGSSIKDARVAWSRWLTVQGTQQFSVSDANGSLPTDDLSVMAYFRNSLL